MSYAVKEIFKTIQGEGAQAGRTAVFCRFSGCNLWSGREQDRAGAQCLFCDTDFVGVDGTAGGRFANAELLAQTIADEWAGSNERRYVVLTGGEPLLQVDAPLVDELHRLGFEIGVETNGTRPAPEGIDWLCVSPKGDNEIILTSGNELKLVFPQADAPPKRFEDLEFEHFFLQPMDCPEASQFLDDTINYCLENPRWRLSLQSHKLVGIR